MSEAPVEESFYPGSTKRITRAAAQVTDPDAWRQTYFTKWIGGRQIRLYKIGELAQALGVTTQTVRDWTNRSYIPQSPYRLPDNMVVGGEKVAGRRLYTEGFIDAVVTVMEKHDMLGKSRIVWRKHPGVTEEIIDTYVKARRTNPDAY